MTWGHGDKGNTIEGTRGQGDKGTRGDARTRRSRAPVFIILKLKFERGLAEFIELLC